MKDKLFALRLRLTLGNLGFLAVAVGSALAGPGYLLKLYLAG